jgi:SAM-dependent methyltransferase
MSDDIKYIHNDNIHNTKAVRAFMSILIDEIGLPESVVDIGCGTGTWLSVFIENGAREILGIDGDYVDREKLYISESAFLTADLEKPFRYNERFDLAICLEVAEHLNIEASDIIVETLCNLSDRILFSAALPRQGGQNHINEQSFDYWKKKFNNQGYVFRDIFREKIWSNENIDWWYRQNMFLVEKVDQKPVQQDFINDYYHPEAYMHNVLELNKELERVKFDHQQILNSDISIKTGFKIFIKSIIRTFKN